MKKSEAENYFLDYIEGNLSASEKQAFEELLSGDQQIRASFAAYKDLLQSESIIAAERHEVNENFTAKVMQRIEEKEVGFFRRLYMELVKNKRTAYATFAGLAGIICVTLLTQKLPDEIVYREPGVTGPVLAKPEQVASTLTDEVARVDKPAADPAIKDSARIEVDSRSAVEGWAKPGSNVDVVWSTQARGKQAVAVISENVKVLGVERNADGKQEILLDASPEVRKKLDLAKQSGTLSLSLRGDNESGAPGESHLAVSDLLGSPNKPKALERSMPASAGRLPAAPQDKPLPGLYGVRPQSGIAYKRSIHDSYQPPGYALNAETYAEYEENLRTDVNKDPVSTFSIDVDTASYANARRYLQQGSLPPKDSVRIEEFLNYFKYDYPQQFKDPFSVSYEIAPSPLEDDRYLLKLGIKARDMKTESDKPWNLVFLVDVSGSMMDANKLPLVQKSLRLLTENMRSNDQVAIVTYAGNAGVVLEPTKISEKQKILSAIDRLTAGGSTYGSGGITAAYEQALKSKISGGINRVVLATDGDFNVGITSRDDLIKLIEEKRKSGITLTTLGFGTGNINDAAMEQLANKGNGNYFYIDSFQEARKVLEEDLFGTMEVVAKDVKLQIEFNPGHVASYRLIGYENRKLKREDFNNDKIDAGEIGSGHTVTALYELVLAGTPLAAKLNDDLRYQPTAAPERKEVTTEAPYTGELAFLKIRYKDPEAEASKLLRFPVEKQHLRSKASEASADFNFAAAVSYFGHLLRDSQYKGDYTYSQIAELAAKGKGDDKHGYRREFIELVKNANALK